MANDTVITVIGNLTADPELRFTQSGVAVASFTIASTPRTFDRQSNEWKDGEALFLRCSIWRDAAENVAESLEKGTRVVAQGRLKQRSFTDREGQNRTSIELDVDEIGPSLKYATAKPNKVQRGGGGGGGRGGFGGGAPQGGGNQGGYGNPGNQGGQGGYNNAPQGAPAADPWAGGGNQGGYDDPPF
ncbi:single-stranded DNA-binding protein [Brachybacterium ginsengisoli]|uniref:Single-stranded DNA-binding protein n=1 Tax=Brachybacterium ginsengisoli TaxID=1331682 RepID=A0A291H1N2_9MICO|nr:single-stranded DNA-binding protein [Brachybacterium ginsengisoli]ATG56388.1 single-stranded DNA-binding protein [Brachybacterium ginsengisoli]